MRATDDEDLLHQKVGECTHRDVGVLRSAVAVENETPGLRCWSPAVLHPTDEVIQLRDEVVSGLVDIRRSDDDGAANSVV
jgi:hypothetical protein